MDLTVPGIDVQTLGLLALACSILLQVAIKPFVEALPAVQRMGNAGHDQFIRAISLALNLVVVLCYAQASGHLDLAHAFAVGFQTVLQFGGATGLYHVVNPTRQPAPVASLAPLVVAPPAAIPAGVLTTLNAAEAQAKQVLASAPAA